MNFSENQRIGSLAEQDVCRLFTSWSWGVGHDQIDAGYDLMVEPARVRYGGARFLVQVKGTARAKRGSIVAQVSKKRLREYLANPLPVLIVRAFGDGTFYWVHAQSWAEANRRRLEGNGKSGVRIGKCNELGNRQLLETFLDEALKPLSRRAGSVSKLAQERSHFLSSIDPRLGVRISASDHGETYEIFAQGEAVSSTVQFHVVPNPGNADRVRDIFDFGLPGSLSVDEFRLEGSALYDAIGASAKHRGNLTIQPTQRTTGFVHLFGGGKSSAFAPCLSTPAELFRGHRGFAVKSNDDSILNADIRTTVGEDGSQAEVRVGFRDRIYSLPIKDLHELADVPPWAESVTEQKSMVVELSFRGIRAQLPVSGDALQSMESFLWYSRFLGRLHLVARATDSEFKLRNGVSFEDPDSFDVGFAYRLLKGERVGINIDSADVELHKDTPPMLDGEFVITTTIAFKIDGQDLCTLPVRIDLPGYVMERIPDSDKHRLIKGADAQAWATFAEGEQFDGEVSRKNA